MGEYRNPDLQRILAGLSGTHSNSLPSNGSEFGSFSIPGLGLLPPEPPVNHASVMPLPVEAPVPARTVTPARAEPPVQLRNATPAPDPSAITTWPAALKYVTKYIITNEKMASRIKHLIAQQAKHERDWWAGREALVEKHMGRAGKQVEVAALLRRLGGLASPIVVSTDPSANQKELEAYDRKVYGGMVEMSKDYDKQLRGLGIPFFAIKHELVVVDNGARHGTGQVLDKGELKELQRKVLQILEDLLVD